MTKQTILLAGDSFQSIRFENSVLDRKVFNVFTAFSGKEAFFIHRREKVNLLVIDLAVTDPAPEVFCSDIRSNADLRKTSILILGSGSREDKDRFSKCNANLFLEKPFSHERFQENIAKLLKIAPRKNYRSSVHVKVTSRLNSETFTAFSKNLSRSGMLLLTDRLLDKGERLGCAITLPDIALISVEGLVVRTDKSEKGENGYGVKFTRISLQDSVHIDTLVHSTQQ